MPIPEVIQGLGCQQERLLTVSRSSVHGAVVVDVQVMNLGCELTLDGISEGRADTPLVDNILNSFQGSLVCPLGDLDIWIIQNGLHHLWLIGSLVAYGPVVLLGEVCAALVPHIMHVTQY